MRVTVVGGAGFIGSVLVRQLLERGNQVTVLDILLYGDQSLRPLLDRYDFTLIHGDQRNPNDAERAMLNSDAVVHLGALVGEPACNLNPTLAYQINTQATRTLAETAKRLGISRFLFASTCSLYGASSELLSEETPPNPMSHYDKTKYESERLLQDLSDDTFRPTHLRLSSLHGMSYRPRFDLAVNLLSAKAVEEGNITIFGGKQWRPLLHVADIARGFLACLEAPIELVGGEVFNVGDDTHNYQIEEIGKIIHDLTPGSRLQILSDEDDHSYRVAFAKMRQKLNFQANHSIADSVRDVQRALANGQIGDYKQPHYSNHKYLLQDSKLPDYFPIG